MALSCPTGGNLADIALQLKATALEAEQRIYTLEQGLRSGVNRPTLIRVSNAPITGIIANADELINDNGGPFTTTFVNVPLPDATPVGVADTWSQQLGEGLYEIGLCATAVASGVVDNNTARVWSILHMRPDPTVISGLSIFDRQSFTTFETNTGVGSEVAMTVTFRMRPGDRVQFQIFHLNVSSTLTISTGAILWMHKLSDATITKVL